MVPFNGLVKLGTDNAYAHGHAHAHARFHLYHVCGQHKWANWSLNPATTIKTENIYLTIALGPAAGARRGLQAGGAPLCGGQGLEGRRQHVRGFSFGGCWLVKTV